MNDNFVITDLRHNGEYPVQMYSEQGKTMIYITAYIIDRCNLNCPYCYNRMPRTYQMLNLDYLYNFVAQLHKVNTSGKRIGLGLIGGEPSLHPRLLEFVDRIHNLDASIFLEMFTNLSYSSEFYIELLKRNVSVAASWHSTGSNPQNQHYIDTLKSIPKEYYDKNLINIRIMMGVDDWEYAKNTFFDLRREYNDYIEVSILTDGNGPMMKYTQEQLDEFKEFKNTTPYNKELFTLVYGDGSKKRFSMADLFLNPQLNFKYWKCEAGLNNLYIHVDGNIYNCQSYWETGLKPIYNLNDCEGMYRKDAFKTCICAAQYCACDFEVPKQRIMTNWYAHK